MFFPWRCRGKGGNLRIMESTHILDICWGIQFLWDSNEICSKLTWPISRKPLARSPPTHWIGSILGLLSCPYSVLLFLFLILPKLTQMYVSIKDVMNIWNSKALYLCLSSNAAWPSPLRCLPLSPHTASQVKACWRIHPVLRNLKISSWLSYMTFCNLIHLLSFIQHTCIDCSCLSHGEFILY